MHNLNQFVPLVITQTPTEEHAELILEPQETDITSGEKEDECPDIDIVKEKDGLDTKSENSVSNNIIMMISPHRTDS